MEKFKTNHDIAQCWAISKSIALLLFKIVYFFKTPVGFWNLQVDKFLYYFQERWSTYRKSNFYGTPFERYRLACTGLTDLVEYTHLI